jgi:diguanylate cyclase (GGDEF)-like protein
LGASWVINKEKFFHVDWVDDLKLKVSYGQVGNDNIESLSLGYYHYSTNYDIVNSNGSVSLVPVGRYGNRKITWETTGEFNVGVDFGLFKNRLNGTFEFYSRKTTDMLFNFSLPQSFGYTGYYDNVGDMINNGLELTLNGDIIRTRDFVWSACKEILNNNEIISSPTACIIFDLNNLKFINDTMGHSAGDRLIVKFAGLLRSVFPEKDFVGRYGGDEFMVVIYDTDKAEVDEILKCLCLEKDKLNNTGNELQIDYACGWAISEDYKESTLQILFDSADSYMYENKQLCKKQNQ